MKNRLLFLCIVILGLLGSFKAVGQDKNAGPFSQNLNLSPPESSLLAVSTPTVIFQLSAATTGLADKPMVSDSSARLIISSVITNTTRTLSASVSAVPPGTSLTIQAQTPNNNFEGTVGEFLPAVSLPVASHTNIITGIGSCYSGTATDDGYRIKYTWVLPERISKKAAVKTPAQSETAYVTLTISEEN